MKKCEICNKKLTGNEFPHDFHRACLKQEEI